MKQVIVTDNTAQYYLLFLAKCLLWKAAADKVDELREYRVLNKTCYKAMEAAAKLTATEKGLKGDCLAVFVSK